MKKSKTTSKQNSCEIIPPVFNFKVISTYQVKYNQRSTKVCSRFSVWNNHPLWSCIITCTQSICDFINYSMSHEMKKYKVNTLKVGTITIKVFNIIYWWLYIKAEQTWQWNVVLTQLKQAPTDHLPISIHNFSPGILTVCNLHLTYSDINVSKIYN